MWDYDKLFAKGNIVGVKNCYKNKIFPTSIDNATSTAWLNILKNNNLCCKDQYVNVDDVVYTTDFEIQYIIRLDEHGNVVEKLFDRDRDMPKLMPKLETGMFVRVPISGVGFVDAEHNRIIYQTGGYDLIDDDDEDYVHGIASKIVEVYSKDTYGFRYCNNDVLIWRDPDYQAYLDSKHK